MSTRSLTILMDGNTEIAVLYRHWDGHPESHGAELATFLSKASANGANCLAAQVVAHFKIEPKNFYLYPAGTRRLGEEYRYTVYGPGCSPVRLRTEEVDAFDTRTRLLFDGPAADYAAWLQSLEAEAA